MKFSIASPELKTEIQAFLNLAVPLASAQIAQAMTGFVDTLMMGRLGETALAAGGLAVMIFTALLMTGISSVSSVSSLAAEAYGAQRPRRIGEVNDQGLWLALLLALTGILMLANLGGLLGNLGQAPSVVEQATVYINTVRWALLPGLGFAVLRGTVTALSQTRPIMVIVIAANLLNVVGNYVFAFGKLGFPALGLQGLALASVLAHTTMFASLLAYSLRHQHDTFKPFRLFRQLHRLQPAIFGNLLTIGFPIGVITILENGLFTVMSLMVGAIGVHVLAAQQLALQTVIVTFMMPLGMSYAATVRVGQWYGQRDWAGVRRAAVVSLSIVVAVMTLSGIVFVLYPQPIIGLYLNTDDPANRGVVKVGVAMLTVAGFGQVVDGVQRVANAVLQGLQDTKVPMLLSLVAFWGVGLLTGYWLGFQTPLGGVGIWIGAYLGLAIAAIAYLWRFWYLLHKLSRQASTTESDLQLP